MSTMKAGANVGEQEGYKKAYERGKKETIESVTKEQAYNSLCKAEEFLRAIIIENPHNVVKDSIIKSLHHTRKARKAIQ